jgi:ADP-ribose pyrophosphatase YjhB (NUDIX family)
VGVQDGWRLCPRCGGALTRVDDGALGCPDCGSRYYAHSMPTANAIVVDGEGRVLMGRRAHEPEQGKWDVLGGFVHEGEEPEAALRRELKEETGLDVEPEGFLGAWLDVYGAGEGAVSTLNLVWTARVAGGEMAPADDVAELAWFAPDELPPPEECAFDCVEAMLSAWRQQQA